MPSDRLRKLEVDANSAFEQYRDMYFEGGVSSVYLWDLEQGFAGQQLSKNSIKAIDLLFLSCFVGCILIKKAGDGSAKIKGCWDSIHVFEVQEKTTGRFAHYKLTSTVMLWLQTNKAASGTMNLGGSLTRQVSFTVIDKISQFPYLTFAFPQMEQDSPLSDSTPHIANIGKMVEDMETKIRTTLNEIYFSKTKDIVNGLRSVTSISEQKQKADLKRDLARALQQRNAGGPKGEA